MTTPPYHLPPMLIDARPDRCPDVFTVQCTGAWHPDYPGGRQGTTPMGYERRTVYRAEGESDAALYQRVELVVKHFKDSYGYAQSVAVIFYYELTPAEGAARRMQDDLINANALRSYLAGLASRVSGTTRH